MGKQWVRAPSGPSGVVGDGARRQIGRGTWETRRGGASQRSAGINNRWTVSSGVGPAHSSEEAGNDRGAKGPGRKHAESEGGNSAWTKVPLRKTSRKVGRQFSSEIEAGPLR